MNLDQIKDEIALGNLDNAISKLLEITKDSSFRDEAIHQSYKFEKIRKDTIKGIISRDEQLREESQICNNVLGILNSIDNGSENIKSFAKIQLLIEGHINDFSASQKRKLTKVLSSFLEVPEEDIRIVNIIEGSIIATITIPYDRAVFFMYLNSQDSPDLQEIKELLNIVGILYIDEISYCILELAVENLNNLEAPNFKQRLQNLFQRGINNLIIDLGKVSFIDASGLASVLYGFRLWEENGNNGNFILANVNENVLKLMNISKLDNIITILPTIE